MIMKKYFYYILCASALALSSCDNSDEPKPDVKPEKYTRTILAYAIASNNLADNIKNNRTQMLAAMDNIDTNYYNFMIYEVYEEDGYASLMQAQRVNGEMQFMTVKQYSRATFSTDPRRLREVILDVNAGYPSDDFDMMFLSHGNAWEYDVSVHPSFHSLGFDKYDGKLDFLNIDELAAAIPEGVVDMIWFDNCYMSNIETAYELKDKCDYIVACPTEIWSAGTPYHLVVPYLMKRTPDRAAAASQMGEYYKGMPYTVTLMDLSKIEKVAEVSKKIFTLTDRPSAYSLLCYSRRGVHEPMYDFGQYLSETAQLGDRQDYLAEFKGAMNDFVIYTSCSDVDFNNRPIDRQKYSGVSTHYFYDTENTQDDYYRTLAWYRDVVAQ